MKQNPLLGIQKFGQSIWQDDIQRKMIQSGELTDLIENDGIRGVTSNPSIFEKAIAGSDDYKDDIRRMAGDGKNIKEIYQFLTVRDVSQAADNFRKLYDSSNGKHGFVSLEVNPHLARDVDSTVAEAHKLWKALDRPNVFIKVPATREGLICIRQLISEGINVNVTLLFGLPRYREVADAYISGLEDRLSKGKPIDRLASVASFFLSRIDVLVDQKLERIIDADTENSTLAKKCHGQVAIASARQAYVIYQEIFNSERFQVLEKEGGRAQGLLWASTSTKNPDYSDVKYVEALIGPETVNTLPRKTIKAYRDHGRPEQRLTQEVDMAKDVLAILPKLGIDIDEVTAQLENEGIEKFNKPYDSLMETLTEERDAALRQTSAGPGLDPAAYGPDVEKQIRKMAEKNFVARLWEKDTALWSSDPDNEKTIRNGLGWLNVAEKMVQNVKELIDFAKEINRAGFSHVVHMGMGGSSLAPLTFQRTFAVSDTSPFLIVLDTTDPATVSHIEKQIPIEHTLFIVASKSGTTAEPLAFMEYFYANVQSEKGDKAGENFVVITDPDTPLADLAAERHFRRAFLNFEDIGGRYSALSYFGLVPAALMGVDVNEFLTRAVKMQHDCGPETSVDENPGICLGVILGTLAKNGRNKVTFLVPAAISTLGVWLEQLLAESTGKEETGLIPVAGEPVGYPILYDNDRVFVYIRIKNEPDERLERSVDRLRGKAHPVITLEMTDRMDLAREFLRWEIATATAGSVLGINAFNQPNVQESKDNTDRLLKQVETDDGLPEEKPTISENLLSLYDTEGAEISSVSEGLIRFFSRPVRPGDYLAILAYLTEESATDDMLSNIRTTVQSGLKIATTMGYGPRYLHSTGQLHKGGPNAGIFLQLTTDIQNDIKVPEKPYTFGILRQAQARGDLEALHRHGRRAIRIHLSNDLGAAMRKLKEAMNIAISSVAKKEE